MTQSLPQSPLLPMSFDRLWSTTTGARRSTRQATVPWLQLKGHWLEQAGFNIDSPVTVRVMRRCLVLTTE